MIACLVEKISQRILNIGPKMMLRCPKKWLAIIASRPLEACQHTSKPKLDVYGTLLISKHRFLMDKKRVSYGLTSLKARM